MFLRSFTRSLSLAGGLLLAAGCGGSGSSAVDYTDPNLIAASDFESVIGWLPDPGTLTKEQAHSGRYSIKVDPAHEFGMGFGLPLGKATIRKPRKIRLAAWGFMVDDKSAARLGLQIMDPATGKEIFGDGINYNESIKNYGKWVEISKDVTIPETAASTHELRVFLWRSGATTPAYVDDLRITLLE